MFRAASICLAVFSLSVLPALAQPAKPLPPPPAAPAGTEVTIDGMTAVAPASWKAERPANQLRTYQFKLPKADADKEDAELWIMPVQQGTVEQNIAQWKELFILPAEMAKADAAKQNTFTLGKATIHTLDIRGTYLMKHKPIDVTAKEARPDYRMLAALWDSKEAKVSIRMIGPKRTVEIHAKEFDSWLKSFK
jgi:hypothetical protein